MENKSPFMTIKSSLSRNGDVPDMQSRHETAATHLPSRRCNHQKVQQDRKRPALVSLNQCQEGTTPRVEEADLGLAKGFGMNYHHASESIDSVAKWRDHVGQTTLLILLQKQKSMRLCVCSMQIFVHACESKRRRKSTAEDEDAFILPLLNRTDRFLIN
ncbi:putative helicase senataxin [Trichinella pseudospiralis]